MGTIIDSSNAVPRTANEAGSSTVALSSSDWSAPLHRCCRAVAISALTLGCTSLLGIDEEYVLESVARDASYTPEASRTERGDAGWTGTGGRGAGGAQATGGDGGASGLETGGDGGVQVVTPHKSECTTSAECPDGQKCCENLQLCIDPIPIVGCQQSGCDPCPQPPLNGLAECTADGTCEVQCIFGYRLKDTGRAPLCVPLNQPDGGADAAEAPSTGPPGAGGSPGAGGTLGEGGTPSTSGAPGSGGRAPACVPEQCGGCSVVGPIGCCKANDECGCTWSPTLRPCY